VPKPARAYELEIPPDYAHKLEVDLDAHADHIEPRRHSKKVVGGCRRYLFVFLDNRAIPAKGSEQAMDRRRAGSLSFAENIDRVL
jgi:hypothetical protein